MARTAKVKLSWVRSVSGDVTKRRVTVVKGGDTTTVEVPAEASSYMIDVTTTGPVDFFTTVFDATGNETESEHYSFDIDLEAPQPDTDLFHEVLEVVDVPDQPTP